MKTNHHMRWLALGCFSLITAVAQAGGPLGVCQNRPTKYAGAGTVTLNYDQGALGSRTKAQADALVTTSVAKWTDVPTATVSFARGADLPVDVTTANYTTYFDQYSDGLNPVIYDSDGSIIDLMFGSGAKSQVLGFAGSAYQFGSSGCQYLEGQAVINGFLSVSDTTMQVVLAHEIGHLIGMDHTQINSNQGLSQSNYPLMYPIAYRTSATLHEDDVATVSALYPDTTIASTYGELTGTFTQASGTPILGGNIWAREVNTRLVYSIVSDYLKQSSGYFKLLLPPGTYDLHAEAISRGFTGGSSVGPYAATSSGLSFQSPLYTGTTAMTPVTLGGSSPTQFTIVAGCAATAVFRIDGSGSVGGNCATPAPPSCTLSASPSSLTLGASATLTATCSPAATSYSWTPATGLVAGSGNTATVTPAAAGVFSYSVTASNAGGTGNTASTTVTVTAGPPVCTLSASPSTITLGGSSTLTANCSPAATSYTWTPASGLVAGSSNTAVVTPAAAGSFSYSVTGNNAAGAGTPASASVTVTPPSPPICTLNASPNVIAAGGSTYLFATCSPAATSYTWTNTGFASTSSGGMVTPAATTTYSVTGSNSGGSGSAASATVTVGSTAANTLQALFVNASTSTNKTSVLRVINTGSSAGTLTATAFDENGRLLGTANASLGSIAANQALSFSSANLEALLGFTPSAPTAKYSVYIYSGLASLQLINFTQDIATGAKTLSQAQYTDRSSGATGSSVSRSAWFVSAASSTNKTNVLRILNPGTQSGTLSATLYDEAGIQQGSANIALGTIAARQMISYTSAQLESALGYVPPSSTAKYRVVFSANLPSLELINFTKDIATGNLALVQAQLENRPGSSASTSTRNVLLVNPSTSTERNTVLRIVNPNSSSAAVTATAYDEGGSMIGSGTLGMLGANQILALTSAQIESALGYSPSSVNAKYRLVVTANVPTFEVIDNTKLPSNGNLYLAQAQTDNRAASSATSTTRNAYLIYASTNSTATTELRIVNTTSSSAALTATAYDDNGTVIATGKTMGTLAANQMLTFTSAQLESLFGFTPASSTAKWRIVFSASLGNFEVINYSRDAAGLLTLAQPQTE